MSSKVPDPVAWETRVSHGEDEGRVASLNPLSRRLRVRSVRGAGAPNQGGSMSPASAVEPEVLRGEGLAGLEVVGHGRFVGDVDVALATSDRFDGEPEAFATGTLPGERRVA